VPSVARSASYDALVRAALESTEPRRVAELMVGDISRRAPLASWAVLVDQWVGRPRLLAERGLQEAHLAPAQGLAARVLRTGEDLLVPRLSESDPGAPEVAAVGLALSCRGRISAALVGLDSRPASRTFTGAGGSFDAVRARLEHLTFALDSALRIERAEALSVTDDLTGLYNTRFLNEVLRRESKRASRTGRTLCVLFVDLDDFKRVNDAHGHLAGSRTLVEVARILRRSLRESDVAVRYGGDEFALVLPDTDEAGGCAVAARVKDRVASHVFLKRDGLRLRLTVSVGVATLVGGEVSGAQLLQAADAAMYRVKSSGKNAIYVAPSVRHGGEPRARLERTR
jgi:diguanylate cyclase (GGDEF)-like protein